jgi:photosystem I subunit 3
LYKYISIYYTKAGIAQLVEQWTEDPRVTSSNLVPGIFFFFLRFSKFFEVELNIYDLNFRTNLIETFTNKKMKRILNNILFTVFISVVSCGSINVANAAGTLTDCADSPAFKKRLDTSVKKLETRLKKYEPGSPQALALEQQVAQTKRRFDRYAKSDLMCGKDGLPHLITSGDWKHASEFMIPGVMFLYTTGWIGWAGRKYVKTVAKTKNPAEKEIIIDVPLALQIMASAYLWPIYSWKEFISGDFVAPKEEITVSPR